MAEGKVTSVVFSGAPARGASAWSKLMRRKVGKSQLHFIKTVSIYINLTQTVTNTGNVPSFHPRVRRQRQAGLRKRRHRRIATSRRQSAARVPLPVRNRRAAGSQRTRRSTPLPSGADPNTPFDSPSDEYLIGPIPMAYE